MQAAIALLLERRFVKTIEVLSDAVSAESELLIAKVLFRDVSILFVRESIYREQRKYSYHWQDSAGNLIIRWDNSPHHRNIASFPHHKHVSKNDQIESSDETTLAAILVAIEERMEK